MNNLLVRSSFALFHGTLALVILAQSILTAMATLHGHVSNLLGSHLTVLAALEAIAALLFLVPKTLKIGSGLLLAIFAFAIVVHGVQHEIHLLVYAAGVFYVGVHGSVFSRELFKA